MTHHFVNILTWQYFSKKQLDCAVYVDGFLLQLAIILTCKKWVKKRSGLMYVETLKDLSSCLYLLAHDIEKEVPRVVLPIWEELEDISVSRDLINAVSEYDNIVIGISSPKQDELAKQLSDLMPSKNYYCLGAAIYTKKVINSEFVLVTWLTMLLNSPQRTLLKFFRSLLPFALSLFKARELKKFVRFYSIVNE